MKFSSIVYWLALLCWVCSVFLGVSNLGIALRQCAIYGLGVAIWLRIGEDKNEL